MNILFALIETSVYSAIIVLLIVFVKKMLYKKLSAFVQFALWSLFILRLLIPFSVDSGIHLFKYNNQAQSNAITIESNNAAETLGHIQANQISMEEYEQTQGLLPRNESNPSDINIPANTPAAANDSIGLHIAPADIIIAVWLLGIAGFGAVMGVAYMRLNKQIIAKSTEIVPAHIRLLIRRCEQNMGIRKLCEVRISDAFTSTVLLASLRPKLIIPLSFTDEQSAKKLEHCLMHECAHYKRKDYLTYLLTSLLCAVYWFNPFVWLGMRLMKQDLETATDALVIKTMTSDEKTEYAMTLLGILMGKHKRFQIEMGMGLASKKEAEKRLKGVYMKRKMRLRTKLAVGILAVLIIFTCFTTACQPIANPAKAQVNTPNTENTVQPTEEAVSSDFDTTPIPTPIPTPISTTTPIPKPDSDASTHWTQTVKEGKIVVDVDADVKLPEVTDIPVVKAEPAILSQERIKELADYFAQGKKQTVPKEDEEDGEQFWQISLENEDGSRAGYISGANYNPKNPVETYFTFSKYGTYHTESECRRLEEIPQFNKGQLEMLYAAKLDISKDDAALKAEEVISDLSIQGLQLINSERVLLDDTNKIKADEEDLGGYVFKFIRQSGGIAGFQKTVFLGSSYDTPPQYKSPLMQETLNIVIGDEGVVLFDWKSCAKVVETISDNVELAPFKQIQQALIDKLCNKAAIPVLEKNEMLDHMTFEVNAAELRMAYINDKDSKDCALLVPVWVFEVTDMHTYKEEYKDTLADGQLTFKGNTDAYIINAMDGGIVF